MIPRNWKDFAIWLLTVALIGVFVMMGRMAPVPLPPLPVPIWQPTPDNMGWIADPDAVQAIMGELKQPVFAMTACGKSADPIPKEVFLWQIYQQIQPKGPPAKNQGSVGSCVSFGTNNAIARTMAAEIVVFKRPFELLDIAEEVTYAGSRVEIGGGKIRGDGSVGAWAAKFVRDWGVVARKKYGSVDLSTYDVARCRSWGSSGVPDDLEKEARLHPVETIALIGSWEDAKKALASGYGIAICSSRGFSMARDARGVAAPRGSWAHCMCLDGYVVTDGGEFGHIENSWGPTSHTGPVGWGNPSTAGFWADAKVVEQMLKAGDSWAFSSVKGFPRRELDWFVRRQAAPVNRAFASFDPFRRFYHVSAN